MGIESVQCHVLQAVVTRVTDFEGVVSRVNCGEYDELTGTCRVKSRSASGGPLSALLERAAQGRLGSPSTSCDLR